MAKPFEVYHREQDRFPDGMYGMPSAYRFDEENGRFEVVDVEREQSGNLPVQPRGLEVDAAPGNHSPVKFTR